MSSSIVRRLTATLALAAILCLAAPALAAPPLRSHSPATLGLSLLDQVVSWLARLWAGEGLPEQIPLEKNRTSSGGGTDPGSPGETRSSLVDPNG